MARKLAYCVALVASVVLAQSIPVQPRPGALSVQNNSGTLPTASPFPMSQACPTCSPPNFGGQSSTVSGALSLQGCQRYSTTIYAGAGCTLNNVGTAQTSYWAIGQVNSTGVWSRNQALDEQMSSQPSGQTSVHFPGHAADGIGVIQVTPNGITQTGGCTTVTVLIEGSLCAS